MSLLFWPAINCSAIHKYSLPFKYIIMRKLFWGCFVTGCTRKMKKRSDPPHFGFCLRSASSPFDNFQLYRVGYRIYGWLHTVIIERKYFSFSSCQVNPVCSLARALFCCATWIFLHKTTKLHTPPPCSFLPYIQYGVPASNRLSSPPNHSHLLLHKHTRHS